MNTLYLDGGIVGATYTPLGRGELGLAVKKGAAKPDISTVAKLAQAMNGRTVMVNDPKGRQTSQPRSPRRSLSAAH